VGWYTERVLPRLTDAALGRPVDRIRGRVTAELSGQVLEIGFGSGRNVAHYPYAVTGVVAVEPSAGAARIAARRVAASRIPVRIVGADGQHLPLADRCVDHVLVTWTLCTIADPARALAEIARVLRPGGALHFVEHELSPRPSIARWQGRLTPVWTHVAGGCRLDRPIADLVAASELTVTRLDSYPVTGLPLAGVMVEGAATKSG
jgi:ubiquinone/menaquinone biosynthesis C-methylase UbiE